jgi:predicted permease
MGIWSRLVRTFRGTNHDAEIQEELQFHLDMDAAGGYDYRDSRLRLGNRRSIEEETREMGIITWLDSALRDARYGLRQLRKTPLLVTAVVLSLTIGVGANTAIFSLVDAAILRPLPVKDPDSLTIVAWTNEGFPPGIENHNGEYTPVAGGRHRGSSIPAGMYRRMAREQNVFEPLIGVAAYPDSVAVAVDSSPAEQCSLQYVSSNYFQGIGRVPVMGRPFEEDDDLVGHEPVVIISDRFWKNKLGSDVGALNRRVVINSVPARIVGVAPPGFFGLGIGQWPDIYAPLAMKVAFQPSSNGVRGEDNGNWWVRQIGRLKRGVSEAEARTQLNVLFRNQIVPDGVRKIPELVTSPGRRGFYTLNNKDGRALWILMLLVGLLLLIVCANVANLLLSRSVGRQRESAVRLALGAGRWRLFRQHLIESAVLALLGGATGLALGHMLAQFIHVLFQTGRDASNAFDLQIDLRVLGYTAALSILTALLFGIAPALRASRAELSDALKTQTRSVMGGRLRLPRVLVSLEVALCLTALVAAGLLGRTLQNLKWTDVGFDRNNLAYVTLHPSRAGYSATRLALYVDRVREELARLPGIQRVSVVSFRLFSSMGNNGLLNLPGRPQSDAARVNLNAVGEGFFETMQIPLIAGRAVERRDIRDEAQPVVVDEEFAKRFFPNENPLGRRFGLGPKNNRFEIVGVAGNSQYNSLRTGPYPTIYEPYRPGGTVHFAIRTTMDSGRLAESLRKAVASVDPAVPLAEFHTQTALIDRLLRTERLLGFVSGAFGVIALALAAIGLSGLLAYTVSRRTNEIGVRMALGAGGRDVTRMVLRDSLWLAGAGVLVGLPCAFAVAKFLQSALFSVEPLDVGTSLFALSILCGVALLAAWIPARRASRIDPMRALREE